MAEPPSWKRDERSQRKTFAFSLLNVLPIVLLIGGLMRGFLCVSLCRLNRPFLLTIRLSVGMSFICWFPPKFSGDVTRIFCLIGTYQAFEFNSLCFNFACLLRFNFVRCIVKLLALIVQQLYLLALLWKFVGFFPVSLQLLTYCSPLQLRCPVSVPVFIFTTKFKLEFRWFSFCHLHLVLV